MDKNISMFELMFSSTMRRIEFLDKKFDFDINPEHFIQWLEKEDEDITGNYNLDVMHMCEYACLYISMLLYNEKLKGDMIIHYGKFGAYDHYWIGYEYEGKEYYIDLTLKQFLDTAPKLAICEAHNERMVRSYSYIEDGYKKLSIKDYVDSKEAFKFYTNPITMETPELGNFNPFKDNSKIFDI